MPSPSNNVQGAARCDWRAAQTLTDADLVTRQDDYVRKLTQEANTFDNVILEIVGGSYTVVPGDYHEELVLDLPSGHYRAAWVDPETGSMLSRLDLVHEGGRRTLRTPAYQIDIALGIKRK